MQRATSGRRPAPVIRTVLAVGSFLFWLLPGASSLGGQEVPDIQGVVLDAGDRTPIPDVILRVLGTNVSAASDADGTFSLRGVPPGRWTVEVTHLRYGQKEHEIAVASGIGLWLEIRLAEEAIELEPIVVEGETTVQRERRTTGASFWEVTREEIEAAMGTSRHMGDVIRQTVPGLKMRQTSNLSSSDVCLEFRAAASISIVNQRPCNHPMVVVDGVPISDPQYFYGIAGLHNLERIQVIPPGEASTRYGSGSLYGVILVETRRPGLDPVAGADLLAPRRTIRTFDWERDPAGHDTWKALLGATVGNALGLAAGVYLGRRCVYQVEEQLRTSCNTGTTVLAGTAAVSLPALGSALGARWGGRTDASVGSLVPALVGAGLMIFPGYAFSLSTVGNDVATVQGVGGAFLLVGVPLAVTLADRLYRKLR